MKTPPREDPAESLVPLGSDVSLPQAQDEAHEEAAAIVAAAASRGLGTRPLLRALASVLWSAFLGASVSLLTWLLLPEAWLEPPIHHQRLGLSFALLMVLALVPAASQALLSAPRPRNPRHAH